MHGNHERILRQHRHRRMIIGTVRQLRVQRRIDHVSGERDQRRVAVGCRFRHEVRTDDAVGTGAVINDHLLPHDLGHFLRERARHHISAAARGIRDDDANGFSGIVLCTTGSRKQQQRTLNKTKWNHN